jgi:hypothetical protein
VIARLRDSIHVASDAANYRDGKVDSFAPKDYPIAHWPAVVVSAGAGSALMVLAPWLAREFTSFDDFIERGNSVLPKIVIHWQYTLERFGYGVSAVCSEIIVAGISKTGPQAFTFRTGNELPPNTTREEAEASPYWSENFAQLIELPDSIMTPVPDDQVVPANWEGFSLDDSTAVTHWSLLKVLHMQRHSTLLPKDIGGIGGWGQVTSIFPHHCIEQKILCAWPEDKTGEKIRPGPLDWKKWHRKFPKPGAAKLRLIGA